MEGTAQKHGVVYLIENCHDCEKYNQSKLFIPMYVDTVAEYGSVTYQWFGFYINSWPQNLENLKQCDVQIRRAEHVFLKQDSWINVDRIHQYPDSLLSEKSKQGAVSPKCLDSIIASVESCPILERRHKKQILEQFNTS